MKQETIQLLLALVKLFTQMVVQLYKSEIGMVIVARMASSI